MIPAAVPPLEVRRIAVRSALLALFCGLIQALLPSYPLGAIDLPPLSLVLGVMAGAVLARGAGTLPAAAAGAVAGAWFSGSPLASTCVDLGIVALQCLLLQGWMRRSGDPEVLALDSWPRLKRLVLQAAPAAALLGMLLGGLGQLLLDHAAPQPRQLLSAAVGQGVADWGGIVIIAPLMLCWLGLPQEIWRPRRRVLAWPFLLLGLALLPGMDEVARRDEGRLAARFQSNAADRLWRMQQVITGPGHALAALRATLEAAEAAAPGGLAQVAFAAQAGEWAQRVPGLVAAAVVERGPDGALLLRQVFQLVEPTSAAPAPDRLLALPGLQRQQARAWSASTALATPAGEAGRDGTSLLLLQPLAKAANPNARLLLLLVQMPQLSAPALPAADDANLVACLTDGPQPGTRLAGPPGCEQGNSTRLTRMVNSTVQLADRPLRLLVAEPDTADNRLFSAVWLLALPAVGGAGALATLLLALSGRRRRNEDRVRERTAALQAEVDERRAAEAALQESEQRFRAIFDSVNIGVTLVGTDGRLLMVNPAFCTMMGCAAEELLLRPLDEIRLPDVDEDDGTAAAMAGGQAKRQRYLTPDGRVLQVAASLRVLHGADGQPVATVGALQDLTQVLRLREAEREREQAEIAVRTKSEFLSRLSHELRTPLNAIMGFVQMLSTSQDAPDSASQQRALGQIRQAGWHLLDMINDVLDLSRMEAGSLRVTLSPVALPDLVQEALAMVEPAAAQGGVTLELSMSPLAEVAQADATRLRQVLINLLSNAIKYNRPGGRVELRTRPAGVGDLLIEVHDTGSGIPESQMEALFTPFHRLGRDNGAAGQPTGTGIGLVICRRLAELMHGELSVSSTVGEGSVFSLRLPRAEGLPQREAVGATPMLQSHVTIGSVLYIEDQDSDIAVMRALLAQRPGVSLQVARTAAEGLALAHDVDLVLLDLDLPDQSGLSVLQALRADTRMRHTPVVVVSGDTHPQRIDECFDAGATNYLTKPLEAAPLLQAIDAGLDS